MSEDQNPRLKDQVSVGQRVADRINAQRASSENNVVAAHGKPRLLASVPGVGHIVSTNLGGSNLWMGIYEKPLRPDEDEYIDPILEEGLDAPIDAPSRGPKI